MSDESEKGPLGLKWTYLGPYGCRSRYSVDMYRSDGSDSLYFIEKDKPLPKEAQYGTLDLSFTREELDGMIAELTWLRDNWGEVCRDW